MKIFYVILTCKVHENIRQKWQRETWLKRMKNPTDFVYLDIPVDEEIYLNAPKKYVKLFREFKWIFFDAYDWVLFCDDDTFVYTRQLQEILPQANEPTMIGFKGGEFNIYNLKVSWCSGGAGIAMNRELVKKIQFHVQNNNVITTDETDITLAIWAAMAADVKIIDDKRFSPSRPHESPPNCITFHYCIEQDFYSL